MQALFFALTSGILWGAAPLMLRYAGISAPLMTSFIAIGTMISVAPTMYGQNFSELRWQTIFIALAAGIANGIGLITFYKLVGGAMQRLWDLSAVGPICYVLVPIIVAIGGIMFFHESLTLNKGVGIVLAIAAIWFLSQK